MEIQHLKCPCPVLLSPDLPGFSSRENQSLELQQELLEEGDPCQELTGIDPIPVAEVSAEALQQHKPSEGAAVCSGAFPVPKAPLLPPRQEQQHLPAHCHGNGWR